MPSLKGWQAALIGLLAAGVVLLAAGFRPDGLTWLPGAVYSDSATSHYPAALFLRESVTEGEFPLWRDWFMAGAPFAANPLNKTAYPLQWAGAIVEPLTLLNGMVLLHMALAGAGMWRWTRSLGVSPAGALVSALAYLFAPRLLVALGAGHLDWFYAAAWWPWLMDAAGRLGAKPTFTSALWAALSAGLLLLADVRLALYALPAAALAFAVPWWGRGRPWRGLAAGLASAALALVVSVAVTGPLLSWSPWLNRGAQMAADAAPLSLTLPGLPGMAVPFSSGFETLTYVGLTTLLLAVVGVASLPRRWKWALAVGFLLVFLWALGPNGPLWPLLAGQGGLLAWFRVPARAWIVVTLAAAPLAGRGLDVLLLALPVPKEVQPRAFFWYRLGAFGLAAASALAGVALLTVPEARPTGMLVLVSGVGLGFVLMAALGGRLFGRALWAAFVVLIVAGAALGARAWVEWRPLAPWLDEYRALTEFLTADGAARVFSPDYSLPQEAAASAGLQLLGGVDPFQIAGVTDAIRRAGGVGESGYDVVVPPLAEANGLRVSAARPDPALLAEAGASHVVSQSPVRISGLELARVVNGIFIYRVTGFQPAPFSDAIPGWPASWAGVPNANEVAQLNGVTQSAWLVTAGSLIALMLGLMVNWLWTARRVRR